MENMETRICIWNWFSEAKLSFFFGIDLFTINFANELGTWQPRQAGAELCHQHMQIMPLNSVLAGAGRLSKHLHIYLKEIPAWANTWVVEINAFSHSVQSCNFCWDWGKWNWIEGEVTWESKPYKGSTSPWNSAPHSLKAFDSVLWSSTFGMDRVS